MSIVRRLAFTAKIVIGLLLIWVGLVGWSDDGSPLFVALVMLGLYEFLGVLTRMLTGRNPFGAYRAILSGFILGALVGALLFDVPGIYLFHVWTYGGGLSNPLPNVPLYLIEALGWGAFLVIFYDSYTLIHLALDKEFHRIGFSTKNRSALDHIFSLIGVVGVFLFLSSVGCAFVWPGSVWPATIGACGMWLMLEDIEYKRCHRTLLLATIRGHFSPIVSILIASLALGFLFEYFNIIAPVHLCVYAPMPFAGVNFLGVPLFLLVSWAWMFLIFLSIYSIFYRKEPLWL